MRIDLLKSYWIMVVMDVFTRRIIGFGVAVANLNGTVICRMFNRAIAKQKPPRYLFQITIHCFAFIGGLRIFVYLKLMRSKPFPVCLVPMLSLSDLSGRCGASSSIGPYFGTKAIVFMRGRRASRMRRSIRRCSRSSSSTCSSASR